MNPLEAYKILLQRQMSEDRIIVERTNLFLLASSFLFLAFVTLLNPSWTGCLFTALRITLPIVGIVLTILLYFLNLRAVNALTFWHVAQRKIETEAPEFAYLRENEITPHIEGYEFIKGKKVWIREEHGKWVLERRGKIGRWLRKPIWGASTIYWIYLPLAFLALWTTALVLVFVC